MNIWWDFVIDVPYMYRKVACIVALLCGCRPRGLQSNLSHRICNICNSQSCDTPVHILFECEALVHVRYMVWDKLVSCMPARMAADILECSNIQKYTLMISGLKCTRYVREWRDIFRNVAFFVHTMYNERKRKYDEVENAI